MASAFKGLVGVFFIGVAVQFLLAGVGVVGGESITPHRILGMTLQLVALLIVVTAFLSKQPKPVLIMSGALLVLMVLQTPFIHIEDPMIIRSLHVFDAFLIVGLGDALMRRAGLHKG